MSSFELKSLKEKYNIPIIEDLGSGVLIDLSKYGLSHEPTVQECIKNGVDIVSFSGEMCIRDRLMTVQPVFDAIKFSKKDNSKVVFLSPQGEVLTQNKCKELSKKEHLIFLCGHYEGIDSRIINNFVDEEISVGDYVVTGGEIPAMLLMDAVCRMVDGVLGNSESASTDSHYNNLRCV